MKQKRHITRTAILSLGLFCFLLGLGFARLKVPISMYVVCLFATFFLFGVLASKKTKVFLVVGLITMFFLVGWWRGTVFMRHVSVYQAVHNSQVKIEAVAEDDAVYSERGQLTFSVNNIKLHDPFVTKMVGTVKVEGFGTPMVYRGDVVLIEGRLFSRRGGQQAGVSFARISVTSQNKSRVDQLRRKFVVGMQNVLPEPLASFALGLLIGQRSTLPKEVTEQLTAVGLIHIVAVSGYNLTIIIHASQHILKKRSRFQALAVSLGLIGIFLLFTGYSPSIVRAAIVSSFALVLWFFGRTMKPLPLILLAAVITAGANPLYVWSNIGWYLSFLAFFGVLVVGPRLLQKVRQKKVRESLVAQILSETLAAQICTLPLILYIFSRLSIISVIANVLVVPFVPLAMLLSLLAGIAGMMHAWIAGVIALPARALLDYMLSVSALLSRVPHANVEFNISLMQMLYMYVLIGVITCIMWFKKPKKPTDNME